MEIVFILLILLIFGERRKNGGVVWREWKKTNSVQIQDRDVWKKQTKKGSVSIKDRSTWRL
jgi:hypothetical protein